jgi:hypothetical protein
MDGWLEPIAVAEENIPIAQEICEQFVAEGTLPQKGRWQGDYCARR